MRKVFYMDESASNPGKYLIRVNVDLIPFETTIGSLAVLPARLLNLSYAQYLRFCRDIIGAEIHGKNCLYPIAYFKRDMVFEQFIKLLNARTEFVLWEDEHPNYHEHERALRDLDRKRNLKNLEKSDIINIES